VNAGAVEWSNKTEVAPVDLPVAHHPETKSCDHRNVAFIIIILIMSLYVLVK
jgi:hypothetical protein